MQLTGFSVAIVDSLEELMTNTGARRDSGRPRGKPVEEAILRATLDDIARVGAEAISVDRIARAAEVNKTTVYRRWPTVEALTEAAVHFATTQLESTLNPSGSLVTDLRAISAIVAAMLSSSEGKAIARAGMSGDYRRTDDPSPAAAMLAVPEQLLEVVVGAIDRGEWDPSIPVDVVLAAMVGAHLHRIMVEQRPPDDEWTDGLVTLLRRGVAAMPGQP
jgi:AcrR family transcriptional regulator